ncbi:SpoIIE family protein phosphatase [Eubacterium sp.]|uniref:SpoIIE family protein phosphatase n=1 Tax=Eubacterium sp. TaxID=142586 RepID=UPI0025DAD0F1|nr:SpoIIE family protein phosphatase [Eubacterium sp.]MCR5628906.1 SpoIIE family protein phosphatase [Eubacterium sp.]
MFSLYYKAVFFISLMLLGIYVSAWHKHFDTKLTVIFTLIPISCLGYVFLDEAENLREVIMSYKMIYIAGCFLQYLLLIYILELCTIKVTKCIKLIAFVLWMGVYLSVLSIGYFPLYYKKISFEMVDGKGRILKEYGFMHTVFYVMLFSFLGIGVYAIIYSYRKKKQISRCTLILMLIPYAFSVFGYIIGSGHNMDVEITPIGYLMLEVAFLLIAYRMVLYDIDDSVIGSMIQKGETGLISFDYKYRYLGSNKTAKKIFPRLLELTIDSPITENSPDGKRFLHWIQSFASGENNEFVYSYKGNDANANDEIIYSVSVSDLYDGRHNRGYIITLVDDTSKRKYMELLDDYNDKLVREVEAKAKDIEAFLEEKKKNETELELASHIQESVLPSATQIFPKKDEFNLFAVMIPAREVGGDFYDFFMIDDEHLCMFIADVSGKGIPAALFMMNSKTTIANCARLCYSPAEILTQANQAICANNKMDMFVTVWLGILNINTGTLVAANAGHEYPFIMKDGEFEVYKDEHGMAIGVLDDIQYKEYTLQLSKGDCIFAYTDGVAEAFNSNKELFGLERIKVALNSASKEKCKYIVNNVRLSIDNFAKGEQQYDDITMLCMKYFGKS